MFKAQLSSTLKSMSKVGDLSQALTLQLVLIVVARIWQRVCQGRHIIRITVGKESGAVVGNDEYCTVILWANKQAATALSKISSIVAYQQLKATDTIEAPPSEETDRETVQGAEQEASPENENQTSLAQDFAREVPETAAPAEAEEQEQAHDAFVEGSFEDSVDASTEALDSGFVKDSAATNLDKLSEDGTTEVACEGSVELSGDAGVDTSTERTAQESADLTGEHDETISPAGTREKLSKPDGQGAENPDPEYGHATEVNGTEDVTEGINNHDHAHNHVHNHVHNHIDNQAKNQGNNQANRHANHQANRQADHHATRQGNNQRNHQRNNQGDDPGNDQEDSFKDWNWVNLQPAINREAGLPEDNPLFMHHVNNQHKNQHNNQRNDPANDEEDSFKDWNWVDVNGSIMREAARPESDPINIPGYFPRRNSGF